MADISDIDDSVPVGSSDPKQGDNEIKQLKTDTKGSFPGFTNNTTAVVTDATLGDATGPELAYAAKTFTPVLKSTYDTADLRSQVNQTLITTINGVLNEVKEIHIGQFAAGVGPTWDKQPAGFGGTITRVGLGRYTITHNIGDTDYVAFCIAINSSAAGIYCHVDNKAINTVDFEFWSSSGGGSQLADPDNAMILLLEW